MAHRPNSQLSCSFQQISLSEKVAILQELFSRKRVPIFIENEDPSYSIAIGQGFNDKRGYSLAKREYPQVYMAISVVLDRNI